MALNDFEKTVEDVKDDLFTCLPADSEWTTG